MKETKAPDLLSMAGRRKLTLSQVYTCSGWARLPGGLVLTMQEQYVKKGKHKGQTAWRGEEEHCFVSFEEIAAERKAWEESTGKCSVCGGDGVQAYCWSRKEGALFRPCKDCGSTGNAPIPNLQISEQ